MKELLPLLASSTVGAIIGYSTNWVAIKMLFRPLKEKRVLGIRVPFTPGVIPRQRHALGSSIGTAVEEYLLTSEALLETISSESFRQHLQNFIDERILETINGDLTIEELMDLLKIKRDKSDLAKQIKSILLSDEMNQFLENFLISFGESLGDTSLNELRTQIGTDHSNNNLAKSFSNTFITDKIANIIEQNPRVNELLSVNITKIIHNALADQSPQILSWLASQCASTEFNELIEKSVAKFLSGNILGSLISGFLPPASLTKMICEQLQNVLSQPETLEFTQAKIDDALSMLFNQKICDAVPYIIEKPSEIAEALTSMTNNIAGQLFSKYSSNTLNDLALHLNISFPELISKKGVIAITNYLNTEKNINEILDKIAKVKIKSLFANFDVNNSDKYVDSIVKLLRLFIKNYGQQITDALQVKNMVENQIDKLELLQVEQIVLSVMNNQLKAITRFGLLLGALLGLVMPFINSWVSSL